MYTIKERPEEFIVEEVIDLKLDDSGDYAYFWLRKREYTTIRAIEKICSYLRCRMRDIGFAGNKDKQAVTRQAISIRDPGRRILAGKFERFNSDDLSLEYIGRGKAPISLGQLEGNRFEIVLRGCDKAPFPITQFVNYFDEQRFSKTNKDVGIAIIKGDFKKACGLIQAEGVQEHLALRPNDYVGAMKELPLKTRLMHIHAYQSWMWNETVSEYILTKYKTTLNVVYSLGELRFPIDISVPIYSVPIIGFGTEPEEDEVGNIIKAIMKKEGLKPNDFVIKSMPELTAEGGKREIFAEIRGLTIDNIGKNEYKLRFMLPKGCYATMAVKRMMA